MRSAHCVEVGLRHDGGDVETGAGMDVGGGLVVSDSSTGLAVDLRVRMLVMHQAEGFRERGMAVSLSYNPTPSGNRLDAGVGWGLLSRMWVTAWAHNGPTIRPQRCARPAAPRSVAA